MFRPDDDRPRHDDQALERMGIRKYASRRLVLYTDIEEQKAVRLPPLFDAFYPELVAYFGELPPARDGSEWQITGYVMRESDRFTAAGLVPSTLPTFDHGLNRRLRFWMREQSLDYYLEHLLLHEATHCFMTTLPAARGPAWYMEGMAEHFATHRALPEGRTAFRIIPSTPDETQGLDRVTLIRKEVDAGRALSLEQVFAIENQAFVEPLPYAWAWAACLFFDAHPDYRERFRELGDVTSRSQFAEEYEARFADSSEAISVQWQLFVGTLCYGYDAPQAWFDVERAGVDVQDTTIDVAVRADAGWQPMRIRVKKGATYELIARGDFAMSNSPMSIRSDANGITIDYADGEPLGRLLAAIVGDDLGNPAAIQTLFDPIDVGPKLILKPPIDGSLYLRINDDWGRLDDNTGELTVSIRQVED